MKTVTYQGLDGAPFTIEYDETAPCWMCGLPVESASMGGTIICPACDCGRNRDGTRWTPEESVERGRQFERNAHTPECDLWNHPEFRRKDKCDCGKVRQS